MDYIYIFKREANGDTSYTQCMVSQIKHPELHNFAIVSNNVKNDKEKSNIDIEGIFFKNYDATKYQDETELEREKLELTAEVKSIQKLEDGTYHPLDLMAHKIQVHLEEENRRSLTFFSEADSRK